MLLYDAPGMMWKTPNIQKKQEIYHFGGILAYFPPEKIFTRKFKQTLNKHKYRFKVATKTLDTSNESW